MEKTFKATLVTTFLLGSSLLHGQYNKFDGFSKEDMVEDFRLATDILKKQHPNPYKFIDSVTYNRKVDSLLEKMSLQDDILSGIQFSPIGLVRDVHTKFSFDDEDGREMYSKTNFLPFPVVIERGKMWVNVKGQSIPYGSEVISINNMSVDDMITATSSSAYSDGFIATGIDRMYPEFQSKFSLLDADCTAFDVVYCPPGSKSRKKITLPYANPTQAYHARHHAVLPLNLLQRTSYIYKDFDDATKTGILTVNSFNLQEAYAYREFSDFFRELAKRHYEHVIIDIRSNGGGNPGISALLYSFLTHDAFRNEYNYRTWNIDIFYPEYAIAQGGRKYSDDDIRSNKNFLYQRFDLDSVTGFYVGNARLKEGQLEKFPRDKDAFDGNVYVLTGGGTVSAATYFASLVQKNKRGLIIGKETGSGEQATTAAWFITYELPRTKAKLTVPLSELYFFNATTDNGRGIMPDKEVPMQKFEDYLQAGKDPEMTFTFEQIGSDKNKTAPK